MGFKLKLAVGLLFISFTCLSQSNVIHTVKVDANADAILHALPGYTSRNYSGAKNICSQAWTYSGRPNILRAVVQFDLQSIPKNAEIQNAVLLLKGAGHHPLNKPNDSRFYLITEKWEESTVCWDKHPSFNSEVYADVLGTASGKVTNENREVDVTKIVQSWHSGVPNYGLLFKLNSESYYAKMSFHSREADDPNVHPVIEITYTLPESGVLTWNDEHSTPELISTPTSLLKKTGKQGMDNKAIAHSFLPNNCEGFLEFSIANHYDTYNIGFVNGVPQSVDEYAFGVQIQSEQGEVSFINQINYYSKIIAINHPLNISDIVSLKLVRKDGKYCFMIYVNGESIMSKLKYEEDEFQKAESDLNVMASIYNLGGGIENVRFFSEGRSFYVNDGSIRKDIWCKNVGNPEHDGLSVETPSSSVIEIIKKIKKFGPNDKIYVDAGSYISESLYFSGSFGLENLPVKLIGAGRYLTRFTGKHTNISFESASGISLTGFSFDVGEILEKEALSLLYIVSSNDITISKCFARIKNPIDKPILIISNSQDVNVDGNIFIKPENSYDVVLSLNTFDFKFSRNWLIGGTTSFKMTNKNRLPNALSKINRNFFSNSSNGLKYSASDKVEGVIEIANNNFYNEDVNFHSEGGIAEEIINISLINNIFQTYSDENKPCIYIGNYNEKEPLLFKRMEFNLFYGDGNNIVRLGEGNGNLNFELFSKMLGEYYPNDAPLYLKESQYYAASNGNLNLIGDGQDRIEGTSDVLFNAHSDINYNAYEETFPIGAGLSLQLNSEYSFYPLTNSLQNNSYVTYDNKLRIRLYESYDKEQSVLLFKVFGQDRRTILNSVDNQQTGASYITYEHNGINYLEIDLCGAALDDYNVLEVYLPNDRKMYLRFTKPTNSWYTLPCPVGNIEYSSL